MKTYVTYWHCPKCDIQLEYRDANGYFGEADQQHREPRCSECATVLRADTAESWRPVVIVDFRTRAERGQ